MPLKKLGVLMLKICSVVGARPQLIKEAVVQNELLNHQNIHHILVHTGQHYDFNMSGIFFQQLTMKMPDYHLGVSGQNGVKAITSMMLELEKVFLKEEPELCIVYGDTNSTLAASLVASKLNIRLAHIESGLRQHPKSAPEESNRVITDHLSDFLFAPTLISYENLLTENVKGNVYHVGDVMYDIFLKSEPNIDKINTELISKLGDFVLLTLHRNFNVDDERVLSTISIEVQKLSKDIKVVFPVHPRTLEKIKKFGLSDYFNEVEVIEPLDYYSLMALIKKCRFVITDSGGLQKEAYFCRKPALVIMQDTSWRELTNHGFNILVEPYEIYSQSKEIVYLVYPNKLDEFYGNGNAAVKIIDILLEKLAK